MKILFSHLKKYLLDKSDINAISKSLFQLGHENDLYDDILDIEFTPNKGDCLSVMGLARDLKALHEVNLKTEIYEKEINDLDFHFTNNAVEFCPQISFLKINIDKPSEKYKDYLENYFSNLNIKKVNFFTDISNYLAYEIGQPTHCYDFESVKNGISLSHNPTFTIFRTLLEKEIKLKPKEYVFFQDDEIINLAGIVGGESTKCKKSTDTVLIECAFFNPDMIIGKSVKYDISSDAAYKFERGVDIDIQEFALRRFIKIVEDHANINSISIQSNIYNKKNDIYINFDSMTINQILGTNYKESFIKDHLERLGFEISKKIKIPSWRTNIVTINDVAEEIARIVGYDNIPISKINIPLKEYGKDIHSKTNKIRKFLLNSGFYEVINDPFIGYYADKSIVVDNPLDSNRKYLRLDIIKSLIKNLDYNEKRQKDSIKLFEISNIYNFSGTLNSKKMISLIVSGRVNNDYKNFNKKLDKNYLINLAERMGVDESFVKEIDRSSFNSKIKNKIYGLECDINDVKDDLLHDKTVSNYKFPKYSEISDFPLSNRDVSVSIDNINILEEVIEIAFQKEINNLKDVFIFDFYHNEDKNIIKVGFRYVFQSKSRTLEEVEVDKEMERIFSTLLSVKGVKIPGLQ